MAQDQSWKGLPKGIAVWVVLGERLASKAAADLMRVGPTLLIDRLEEVEGIKKEVATPGGRVKNGQFARVLLWTMLHIVGHVQERGLARIRRRLGVYRRGLTWSEEDLVRTP